MPIKWFSLVIACSALIASHLGVGFVQAASSELKGEVDDLNQELQKHQSRVKELDALIGNYKQRIEQKRQEAASLENQLVILDNRIKEKELGVERARVEIAALTLEVNLIGKEIEAQEARIARHKELLSELLRKIHRADEVTIIDVLLAEPSLSDFFARLEEVKSLERDLTDTLERVKKVKATLEAKKLERVEKQKAVEEERRRLRKEQLALEAERNVKTSLVSETNNKEEEFSQILHELRQQQQTTAEDITQVESKLKEKLNSIDEALARGDILLNWPMDPSRGITAIFHDPTYPFRHLFEHPGTDIRAPVGTTVKSAAGGYVAWNKRGRMYGNYTMLVHPGGIATVYAHLLKFLAEPDTYVERQEAIARSGGRPGDPGAGLSTGPHLHFEVRQEGIPADAENFLPNIPNDYYDYYDDYKRLKLR